MVKRAHIWLVDFDKAVGSVKRDSWPCVVMSPNEMNEHLNTILVAPISTSDLSAPFRIPVTFMKKQGLILLDQIGVVDKVRLIRKLGAVTDQTMAQALETSQEIFSQ